MEDVNTGIKMATSVVIMCFIISIIMSILLIGKAFWHNTENRYEVAIGQANISSLYEVASQGRPVNLATMWKSINEIDPLGDLAGQTNFSNFSVYCGSNLITTDRSKLNKLLLYDGYLSYEERDDGKRICRIDIALGKAPTTADINEIKGKVTAP